MGSIRYIARCKRDTKIRVLGKIYSNREQAEKEGFLLEGLVFPIIINDWGIWEVFEPVVLKEGLNTNCPCCGVFLDKNKWTFKSERLRYKCSKCIRDGKNRRRSNSE